MGFCAGNPNKASAVFFGEDETWAITHGYIEADLEEGYDGCWYKTGYAPKEIPKHDLEDRVRTMRNSLLYKYCDTLTPLRWLDLTDEQREAWVAYRRALLDLPQQEGFPWDGGGDKTPWPEIPQL